MILIILLITILISWIGLLLAQLGLFSLHTLLLSLTGILILLRKPLMNHFSKPGFKIRKSWEHLAFLLILLACLALYARPHEYLMGHWDPGTYMNTGFHIARTGSIEIQDPLLLKLNKEELKIFANPEPGSIRYPGFYLKDPLQGTMVPQFYHVYPVWIAIFLKLFGTYGTLFVNVLFSLLSLWTFWSMVRSLFNPRIALISCALLGFSIPQIWNARFPTSEIMAQYFIFSGIYTLYLFETQKKNLFGVLAGAAFGMSLLTRPTAILVLPCLAVYLPCRNWVRFRKSDLAFLTPLVCAGLHLVIQNQIWTKYYVHSLTFYFSHKEKYFYGILFAGLAITFLITALFRKRIRPLLLRSSVQKIGRTALAVFILGLEIYGYWIRPQLGTSVEYSNFIHLGWFIGPLTLFLGCAGLVLWSYRDLSKANLLLFIVTLVETIFFLDQKRTYSSYPWALKRYTPVIIPAFALYTGIIINWICIHSKQAKNVAAALLCLIVLAFPIKKGLDFIRVTDFKGMTSFLMELNQKLDPEGIYLFDHDRIAIPLQTLFGKRVLVLPQSDKFPEVEKILLRWLKEGEKIYYVDFYEQPYARNLDFIRQPVKLPVLSTKTMEPSFGTYPTRIKEISFNPVLYRVFTINPDQKMDTKNSIINIGYNPIGLLEGFDKARSFRDMDKTYRWTKAHSTIRLLHPIAPQECVLKLRLKNPKPKALGPTQILIRVNQKALQTLLLPPAESFKTYFIKIPKSRLSDDLSEIAFDAETWNPQKRGYSKDDRDLGFVIDWIRILNKKSDVLQFIDIGSEKNVRIQNFHDDEANPEAYFTGRWTQQKARLILPWPSSPKELILRVSGYRQAPKKGFLSKRAKGQKNETSGPAKITLMIDDQILAKDIELPNHMSKIRIPIPKDFPILKTSRAVLTIQSTTWNPYEAGVKGFPYKLGVLIDWIKVQTNKPAIKKIE